MCDATVTDLNSSGDSLFAAAMTQDFVDWALGNLGFSEGDWNKGYGFGDETNLMLPLARTLTAIRCLNNSVVDKGEDWSSDILHWARRFFRERIVGLAARCRSNSSPESAAATPRGYRAGRTLLFVPFFYERTVPERAGTLLHEARHADDVPHNAGKRDSSWEYDGAWRWHVCWLAWFISSGVVTSPVLKDKARQRANFILDERFVKWPGFSIK